jgi:hypothetical protein
MVISHSYDSIAIVMKVYPIVIVEKGKVDQGGLDNCVQVCCFNYML